MSNVQIDKDKLDELAMKVYGVSDDPVPMTVDEMIESLDTAAHSRPIGTTHIMSNGEYNVKQFENAVVDVPVSAQNPPVMSSLTVTPNNRTQVFNDPEYDGYKPVTVYAMPSGSATAPSTISGTSATVSAGTNTLTLSKTVSVTPTVSAGYVSSGTAGNSTVSLTANVTTKTSATITPGTTNQTIASGTYLTGTQTISGDSNLVAGNIKSGTTIFGVTGTYSGGSAKNFQAYIGQSKRTANSYGATAVTLTVAKTGTYNVSWTAWRSSSSGTMGTNLHRNSTAGTKQQTWVGTYGQNILLTGQSYTQGDVLTVWATSGSTSRSVYVSNLIIQEQ